MLRLEVLLVCFAGLLEASRVNVVDSGSVFTWSEGVSGSASVCQNENEIRSDEVVEILNAMTDDQKQRWMVGIGMRNYVGIIDWRTDRTSGTVEQLKSSLPDGIALPPIFMMDNGQGFRNDAGAPGRSTVFPPGAALGMTWDVDLVRSFSGLLARLFKHRGSNLILGPGLTMMRTPFGSRNWEYISGEEAVLGGVLGAAFAQGAKAEHVLTQAKHWTDNHQELDRKNMVASMDVETQMEVHLKPFEYFLRFGGGSSVMCGYNRVQLWGVHDEDDPPWECEDAFMLQYAKRKYPNFWVGSDWWAVRHTAIDASQLLAAGMDQELPGNEDGRGDKWTPGVLSGHVSHVNASVLRMLRALHSHGMLRRHNWPDSWHAKHAPVGDQEAYQAFNGHNGNARPFTPSQLEEGAAAAREVVRASAVLLRNGGDLLPLRSVRLRPGAADNIEGVEAGAEQIGLFGCDPTPFSAEADWSGFFVSGGGSGAVTWERGSGQVQGFDNVENGLPSVLSDGGTVFHVRRGDHVEANSCDIAVVCYSAYSAEEYAMPNNGDRTTLRVHTMWGTVRDHVGYFGMPSEVRAAGCAKTVAVVSAPGQVSGTLLGGAEGMGDFDAVVYTVFPGEQFGPGLTDLMYARGGVGFGGKLSVALPETDADMRHFATRGGTTRYTERGAIGHKWMQVNRILPAYPFGYGLAYTPMVLDSLPQWVVPGPSNLKPLCAEAPGHSSRASGLWAFTNVCVRNLGDTWAGSQVVQFYFQRQPRQLEPFGGPDPSSYLELAHFVKVHNIGPGSVQCVRETKFAPPQRWDAVALDMVDMGAGELRMFVGTQGVGPSRFGGSRQDMVRRAGGNLNNSVAALLEWEPLELEAAVTVAALPDGFEADDETVT